MINIKEYTIQLDNRSERFYENMAKFLKEPVEKVLERTLVRDIDLMYNFMDIQNEEGAP